MKHVLILGAGRIARPCVNYLQRCDGLELTIINDSAVPMTVFAPGSDQINDTAGSTGVVHMPNAMVIYTCTASGKWYAEGLGTGFAPRRSIIVWTLYLKSAPVLSILLMKQMRGTR